MNGCESWTLKKAEHWRIDAFELWSWRRLFESGLDSKEIKPVSPKGNQPWIFTGRTDAEAEAPILWPPDAKSWLIGKDPDAGKDWGQEEKGGDRGWDGWIASLTQWTWVWANYRRQWSAGKPGVLQFMGSQLDNTKRLSKKAEKWDRRRPSRVSKLSALWNMSPYGSCRSGLLPSERARQLGSLSTNRNDISSGISGWDVQAEKCILPQESCRHLQEPIFMQRSERWEITRSARVCLGLCRSSPRLSWAGCSPLQPEVSRPAAILGSEWGKGLGSDYFVLAFTWPSCFQYGNSLTVPLLQSPPWFTLSRTMLSNRNILGTMEITLNFLSAY